MQKIKVIENAAVADRKKVEAREADEPVVVRVDLNHILIDTIDDIVWHFAQAMTPPGGDPLRTTAALYGTIRNAADAKAQAVETLANDGATDAAEAAHGGA